MTVSPPGRVRTSPPIRGLAWRTALIALPTALLALLGGASLLQDRRLAEAEIRERARDFAQEVAQRCWRDLTTLPPDRESASRPSAAHDGTSGVRSFRISTQGTLLDPPDCSPVPTPHPLDEGSLSPEQLHLWREVRSAVTNGAPSAVQAGLLQRFLGSHPTAALAAPGRYRLAVLLRKSDPPAAAMQFAVVAEEYPDAIGETGLPLLPLAILGWLEGIRPGAIGNGPDRTSAMLKALCSNVIAKPGFLTPWALEQAASWEKQFLPGSEATKRALSVWGKDEVDRAIFHAAARWLAVPSADRPVPDFDRSHPRLRNAPPSWPDAFWFPFADLPPPDGTPLTPAASSQAFTQSVQDSPSRNPPPVRTWLAAQEAIRDDGSRIFICRPAAEVQSIVERVVAAGNTLPGFLGVACEVRGTWMGTRNSTEPIASVSHRSADGTSLVTVAVSLLDPSEMFARQRQRLIWFGTLIGAAAIVSAIGLLSMWTAARHHQRLYQLQSDFVASVTHELRAPIGSVRLIAENFKLGKVGDPQEQQRFFGYMVQECSRLSSMIENVLGLARIEQGRQEYELEPTDLVRLIEDTVRLMDGLHAQRTEHRDAAPPLETSNRPPSTPSTLSTLSRPTEDREAEPPQHTEAEGRMAIHLHIDRPGLTAVLEEFRADGRALQRVLINLLDNAIKHSPAGGIVTLGAAPFPSPPSAPSDPRQRGEKTAPSMIRIWVADQGPGIPSEDHRKIFERFYRRGSELRRETPGVGIGLSLVHHIVKAHHGRVWVESEPGKGSTFFVELPLATPRTR